MIDPRGHRLALVSAVPASPERAVAPVGERFYLTRDEVAARSGLSLRTVDRDLANGKLEHLGGGGYAVRIRPEWVDQWLARRGGRVRSGDHTTEGGPA